MLVGGDAAALPCSAEAQSLWLARELVNTPPCDLYPETFATVAAESGRTHGFEVEVWDESRLAAERMGALLGVARGSSGRRALAILRYTGNPGGPTLGLVGKGVTFDSGGLSLKPTDGMVDMKCDMAGAAAVLAGVQAIAALKLPVNVLGVLALVENMPGGNGTETRRRAHRAKRQDDRGAEHRRRRPADPRRRALLTRPNRPTGSSTSRRSPARAWSRWAPRSRAS